MSVISSAALRGRVCPICGEAHATCGGPSSSVPVDLNLVEGSMPEGQRAKYQDARGNVFNATPEHARKMGLQPVGEPFVVQSTAADAKQADQVENKMVAGPEGNKSEGNDGGGAGPETSSAPEIFNSAQLEALQAAGFDTADKLKNASDDELKAVEGVGDVTVARYREFIASQGANS